MTDNGFRTRRRKMHDGRRKPLAVRVRDDERDAAVHDGDQRIGRAEINADDFTHVARQIEP